MLLLLLPTMMENCEEENGNDEICIYKNGDISDHDYHVEDGSLGSRSQMRENIPRLLGDWKDGYWMLMNAAPVTMVMMMRISTKSMSCC